MPKLLDKQELTNLLGVIAASADPLSLDKIQQSFEKTPRRTLQRWLQLLTRRGAIIQTGKASATRYSAAPPKQDQGDKAPPFPLSPESEEIRNKIVRPLSERRPVAYSVAFLNDYCPNETFYLSGPVREECAKTGTSSFEPMPAGTYARQVLNRLLIDLSWNSSRLEGNTYSLLDTERLITAGQSAPGKDAKEAQMILNHKEAIELLVENAEEVGFNRHTVLNLHAILANNLLGDPMAGGRLRSIDVAIGGSVFHPLAVPQRIEECFDEVLRKASAIEDPFEQSFFAMVQLPYLQPFEDVNKRVSRLAANIPLIRGNLAPLSFIDVPQSEYVYALLGVYELNRVDLLRDLFVWAYGKSAQRYAAVRQSLGEPDPFRLQYRQLLRDTLTKIIEGGLSRDAAKALIRANGAAHALPADHDRFVEVAETELLSLHEGNFARYRVTPSQFKSWRGAWSTPDRALN